VGAAYEAHRMTPVAAVDVRPQSDFDEADNVAICFGDEEHQRQGAGRRARKNGVV
jgi:hypothetical protein